MTSSNENRKQSSRQALIILGLLVLIFLLSLNSLIEQSKPRLTHTLESVDKNFALAWYKEEQFASFVSNADGVVFALPLGEEKLFAFDLKTGLAYWQIELPFLQRGMSVFLADLSSVYIVTAIEVNAYDAKTGGIKWSTELGDGHVSIEASLLPDTMKVHYGSKLYELDLATGKILSNTSGIENETDLVFRIVNDKILLTNSTTDGMCAQQLTPRNLLWCKPDFELIDMVVDEVCELGYAMPDDSTLWMVDLFIGRVLGEASFSRSISSDEEDGYSTVLFFVDSVVIVSFIDSGQIYGLINDKVCPVTSSLP